MRTDLAGLRIGEVIDAEVSEKLSAYEYIVSIGGKLIQVQNHTMLEFEVGGFVSLIVSGVQPLQLRLATSEQRGFKRKIDISV